MFNSSSKDYLGGLGFSL